MAKVTQENREKAESKAKEQGWELEQIRMLTDHPLDNYLMVTLCHIPTYKEYGVHLYNSEQNGFNEGYYTDYANKDKAIERFKTK